MVLYGKDKEMIETLRKAEITERFADKNGATIYSFSTKGLYVVTNYVLGEGQVEYDKTTYLMSKCRDGFVHGFNFHNYILKEKVVHREVVGFTMEPCNRVAECRKVAGRTTLMDFGARIE